MAKANRKTERNTLEPSEPVGRPSHQEIADRAYLLWRDRGSRSDSDLEDWTDAERQLVEERHVRALVDPAGDPDSVPTSSNASEMPAAVVQKPDRRLVLGPDLASK